ncbi:MAG: hypothetical protein O3C45_06150, partial [Bacteroidetes bacterium]|nr:hypothetical protein [Bacteroidota bacterium]
PGVGGPPGGRRPPGGMRPAPGEGREGPPPRIAAFFDESSGRLVMTRIFVGQPGERMLVSDTRFQHLEGLDVPSSRSVRGAFPQQRRLRTVTVRLDHETRFARAFIQLRD